MPNKRVNDFLNFLTIKETALSLFVLVFLGLLIRYALFAKQTADFQYFIRPWYDFINAQGIFNAFQYQFSDYPPLYLYLLSFAVFLKIPALLAVKFISVIFDFFLAAFVFLFIEHRYQNKFLAILGFAAILFAPTIILNGAYWGQSDVIFTSLLVASVYFLVRGRNAISLLLFGIAFAIKAQAVFIFPLFAILFFQKKIALKYFLLFPLPYLLSILPSGLAGRPWGDLFLIYFKHARLYPYLTLNAPSLYQWLPQSEFAMFNRAGIIFAASVTILFIYIIVRGKNNIGGNEIIKIVFLFSLLTPFLLPQMHERYFFPADVFSIIYAFYLPRFFFIPIGMQAVSFLGYKPYLWGGSPNFPLLSLAILAIIVLVSWDLFRTLFEI